MRASLAQGVARQSGIGLSEGSLQDAYNQYVTVEVFFDRPVKLHAWFNTDSPTQMLFPITGRHSETQRCVPGRQRQIHVKRAGAENGRADSVSVEVALGFLP